MTVQVVNAKLQRLTNMTVMLNNLNLTLEAKQPKSYHFMTGIAGATLSYPQ
jgi:hypothetical protein